MATQSQTELAPKRKATPFVEALRAGQAGASQPAPPEPQPEPQPEAEVAEEKQSEVATPEPEQVAKKDEAQETPKLPDLSEVPGFKDWQSSMDRQIAEWKKKAEQAEAKKAASSGPPPELVQKRTEALNQYQLLTQQAEDAKRQGQTDDYIAWEVARAKATEKLLDLDYQIAATKYGLDPKDSELRSYIDAQYEAGEITNEKELNAAMLSRAWERGVTPEKMESLSTKEQELAKREAAIEDTIKAAVDQQVALILQQNGLTGIPATKPTGSRTQKQQLEAQYDDALKNRNMRAALSIQRELASLES